MKKKKNKKTLLGGCKYILPHKKKDNNIKFPT